MKKVVLAVCLILAVVAMAYAANTTTENNGTIKIVLDGSTDWVWSTDAGLSSPIRVASIQFIPSASSDRLIIREGSLTGVPIFDSGAVTSAAPVIKYFPPDGKRTSLYIEATDCTLTTPASAAVYIEYVN